MLERMTATEPPRPDQPYATASPPSRQQGHPGHPAAGETPPYQMMLPRHPDALMVLVLGILSIIVLPLIGPFAWVIGARVKREMAAEPGRWSGEDLVGMGYVLGIVGTVICILAAAFVLLFLLGFIAIGFGAFSILG